MKRVWFNGRDAATLPWWRLQIGMVVGIGDAEMPNAQLREVGRIAVVGKYTNLLDAYKSLIEALNHGGIANRVYPGSFGIAY